MPSLRTALEKLQLQGGPAGGSRCQGSPPALGLSVKQERAVFTTWWRQSCCGQVRPPPSKSGRSWMETAVPRAPNPSAQLKSQAAPVPLEMLQLVPGSAALPRKWVCAQLTPKNQGSVGGLWGLRAPPPKGSGETHTCSCWLTSSVLPLSTSVSHGRYPFRAFLKMSWLAAVLKFPKVLDWRESSYDQRELMLVTVSTECCGSRCCGER